MSLLQINNLSVSFRSGSTQIQAVESLSLTADKGEFVAIVGESGSGKSVSAQAIMRLLPDSASISGEVHFGGERLDTLPESAMRSLRGKRISMIFQEPMSALNPLHSIGRQIEEMLITHQPQLSPSQRKERISELLGDVGLAAFASRLNAYPHQLSGGERQRVMIAIAMANRPELLIADEPTTALDVTLQAQILALLKKLQKEHHLCILMITHDLSIVQHLADRTYVMQNGLCVESGETKALFAAPKDHYTKALIAATQHPPANPLAADAKALIHCENLNVFYHKRRGLFTRTDAQHQALKAASLSVHEGETLGLVGESGSGKSTLALALLRLISSEGSIVYLGNRIDSQRGRALLKLRSQLQIVFQDPYASLNPRMTIEQIVSEGLRVHEPKISAEQRRARALETLQKVGLDSAMLERYPHEFSGGQRQRIGIARAMILGPRFVVLDEPTSALDVSVQAQILTLLKDFQRDQKISYLFISHDLRVVQSIAHRVAVMRGGEIIEMGDAAQIFASPRQDYTRKLIEAALNPAALMTAD